MKRCWFQIWVLHSIVHNYHFAYRVSEKWAFRNEILVQFSSWTSLLYYIISIHRVCYPTHCDRINKYWNYLKQYLTWKIQFSRYNYQRKLIKIDNNAYSNCGSLIRFRIMVNDKKIILCTWRKFNEFFPN